ncbi:auxin transporter-like protein 1 [Sesbania bispinosa]|nr:auxin transporter-like protein 1 [Sesbania bispinosa]
MANGKVASRCSWLRRRLKETVGADGSGEMTEAPAGGDGSAQGVLQQEGGGGAPTKLAVAHS